MRICQGCGGVLGRDCFNEQECVWIGNQQDSEAYQLASLVPELQNKITDLECSLSTALNYIDQLERNISSLTKKPLDN